MNSLDIIIHAKLVGAKLALRSRGILATAFESRAKHVSHLLGSISTATRFHAVREELQRHISVVDAAKCKNKKFKDEIWKKVKDLARLLVSSRSMDRTHAAWDISPGQVHVQPETPECWGFVLIPFKQHWAAEAVLRELTSIGEVTDDDNR